MHNIKTNRHSTYTLNYHFVVVTKYRHKVINDDVFNLIREVLTNIIENKNKGSIISLNYEPDHIHAFVELPPQCCLSNVINSFKTVSSRLVRKEFNEYISKFYWKPYFWSRAYFISTIGEVNFETIKNYIENQKH